MNSDIKPDFEKLAAEHLKRVGTHDRPDITEWDYKEGMGKIWIGHVEPLLSTVKRLQEENEQLKEENRIYQKALLDINKLTEMCEQRSQITFYELPSMVSSKVHMAINDVRKL